MKNYVYFDIESHNAGREYAMPPHLFVRFVQWAVNDGPVQTAEIHTEQDLEDFRDILRAADYVVGHNIITFDLPAVFGVDSLEPLHMAQERKVLDTFYLAHLLHPAPETYVDSSGHRYTDAAKPERAMRWLSLENQCYQLGLPGKFGSLKDIAKKYQPEGTKVADYDYGLIPLDDPDFLYYAEQDVIAVRALFNRLMEMRRIQDYSGGYLWREMEGMSVTARMSRNGILVNQEYARERIQAMEDERDRVLSWLVENYDFPTEGKSPWASAKGKGAILKVMDDFGIRFEDTPDWPRTPKGAPKLGGSELKELCAGVSPEAEAFAEALATLKGQRSIPQLFLDNMKEDGRVHPDITALQRSGRWSVQRPGITVMGEKSESLRADKALVTAGPGKVIAGFDYSAADARAMAALSGDEEYARRFEVDEEGNALHDAHNLTGEALFGAEVYYGDGPREKGVKPALRPVAKMVGLAQNYNIGAYKLAVTLNAAAKKEGLNLHFWAPNGRGVPAIEQREDQIDTRDMLANLNTAYPWLSLFKKQAVEEAEAQGYVENTWGRRMKVEKGREFTAAPALYGQSTTRELMMDAIIRLARRGDYYALALRCIIHDELVLELDEDRLEEDLEVVKECMETTFHPDRPLSMPIEFKVGVGVGRDWREANH